MKADSKAPELSRKRQLGAAEPVRASELQVQPVEWLWPGRVPQGGLTVLAGEPGLGKSLLSIWLASGLSRGDLGTKPAASLFLTAEDSREHTVLPRLVAAGAKCEQVVFPPPEKDGLERSISLPDDIGYLRQLVTKAGVRGWSCLTRSWPICPARSTPGKTSRSGARSRRWRPLLRSNSMAVLLVAHLNKGQNADPLRPLGRFDRSRGGSAQRAASCARPGRPRRRNRSQARPCPGQEQPRTPRAEPCVSDQAGNTGERGNDRLFGGGRCVAVQCGRTPGSERDGGAIQVERGRSAASGRTRRWPASRE